MPYYYIWFQPYRSSVKTAIYAMAMLNIESKAYPKFETGKLRYQNEAMVQFIGLLGEKKNKISPGQCCITGLYSTSVTRPLAYHPPNLVIGYMVSIEN